MILTTFQLSLIGLLTLIIPLGIYNQKRMLKIKEKQKNEMIQLYSNNNEKLSTLDEQLKNYINQYKNNYSEDKIIEALENAGHNKEKVKELTQKYY